MERTSIVLLAALAVVACGKPEDDADSSGAAASSASLSPGIYDGDGAVLRITDLENGNRLFDFAHSYEKSPSGAQVVVRTIVKGAVEVKKGETPKLVADELYPCAATLSAKDGSIKADADCRGKGKLTLTMKPRAHERLEGTYEAGGKTVKIQKATNDSLDVSIEGLPAPKNGAWVYGGGAYAADFGGCRVAVVVRSAEKELLLDVGSSKKAIDLDVRNAGEKCALASGRFVAR